MDTACNDINDQTEHNISEIHSKKHFHTKTDRDHYKETKTTISRSNSAEYNKNECFNANGDVEATPKKSELSFFQCFFEYTNSTSIHGLKYLGDRKRSTPEKICWFVMISTSVFFCTRMILDAYQKWQTIPSVVSLPLSPVPVWKIPFPAVTICPQIKIKQKTFNLTDVYLKIANLSVPATQEERNKYDWSHLVCMKPCMNCSNDTSQNALDFLHKAAPTLNETFEFCWWAIGNATCDSMFTPTFTDDGVCFTFNMLDRHELLV